MLVDLERTNLSCPPIAMFGRRIAPVIGATLLVAGLSGAAQAQGTTTFQLTALSSGDWNSAGVHTLSTYQIGHSLEEPNNQVAYFEFNLDPIKGPTLVSNFLLIPGSTDYDISTTFAKDCGTRPCFKVGIAPQGRAATNDVVSAASNNNTAVYQAGESDLHNHVIGYEWPSDGLHPGLKFNADHYTPQRLQDEINAGGNWVFWARDDFSDSEGSINRVVCNACPGGFENYIWGGTAYSTGIVMIATVANGPATTAVVGNGTYQIKNLNSALNLEVPAGRTGSGSPVDQSTVTATANQQWTVIGLGNGNYTITNVATGLALEVPNASTSPGTAVDVAPYGGHSQQRWVLAGTFDGNYTITNAHSGLPLDVSGALTVTGARIDQFNANGNADQ